MFPDLTKTIFHGNLAWDIPVHTRFYYLDLVSRSQVLRFEFEFYVFIIIIIIIIINIIIIIEARSFGMIVTLLGVYH